MGENKVHYYWLDLVRFTAAFLVLICHFRGAFFVEYTFAACRAEESFDFCILFINKVRKRSCSYLLCYEWILSRRKGDREAATRCL